MFCWQLHFMKWLLYPPGKRNSLCFLNSLLPQEKQKKIRNRNRNGNSQIRKASVGNENVLTWLTPSSHQTLARFDSKNGWSFPNAQFTGCAQLCTKAVWCLPKQERQNWLPGRVLGCWRWQLSVALRLCSYFPASWKTLFCIGLKYNIVEITHHSYCKRGATVCHSCKWFHSNWRTLNCSNHIHFCPCCKATLSLHTAELNILS